MQWVQERIVHIMIQTAWLTVVIGLVVTNGTPCDGLATTKQPTSCPEDSVLSVDGSTCFWLSKNNATFVSAERGCSHDGRLVSIHSAFDNLIVADAARKMYGAAIGFFIGLNDLAVQYDWVWTDQSTFDYNDWDLNGQGDMYQNCAIVNTTTGRWQATSCFDSLYYACAFPSVPISLK